jgi:hypothetical protein
VLRRRTEQAANRPNGEEPPETVSGDRPSLDTLRKKLDQTLGAGRVRTGTEVETAPKPRPAAASFVPGRRFPTALGETFLLETCYAPSHLHGILPVEELGKLPGPDGVSLFPEKLGHLGCSEEIVFLDTETTGFVGAPDTVAFLVGLARYRVGEGLRVEQFFLEDRNGEPALLEAVAASLAGAGALVTYNGATFDAPILRSRYSRHGLADPLAALPHLDLLPPCRGFWRHAAPNCRLVTLERKVLGFERTDDVPGAEIPGVYAQYLRRAAPARLADVFTHNALDLLSLAALLWAAGEVRGGRWNGTAQAHAAVGLPHARRGRRAKAKEALSAADMDELPAKTRAGALKERLRAHRAEGDWDAALETARELRALTGAADPYAVEEEAKVLERQLGRPEEALGILEAALADGIWHPADRAKLEKRLERLRAKHRG